MGQLADALAGPSRGERVHERLAAAWRRPKAADLIRRALVLLADHELNASTFAARVTASTGASLAASVLSGLSALSGPLHGGAARATLGLVRAAEREGVDTAMHEWLSLGRRLPAFGHPLYPQGDVRCQALLAHIDLPAPYAALREAGERLWARRPTWTLRWPPSPPRTGCRRMPRWCCSPWRVPWAGSPMRWSSRPRAR